MTEYEWEVACLKMNTTYPLSHIFSTNRRILSSILHVAQSGIRYFLLTWRMLAPRIPVILGLKLTALPKGSNYELWCWSLLEGKERISSLHCHKEPSKRVLSIGDYNYSAQRSQKSQEISRIHCNVHSRTRRKVGKVWCCPRSWPCLSVFRSSPTFWVWT